MDNCEVFTVLNVKSQLYLLAFSQYTIEDYYVESIHEPYCLELGI